MLGVGRPGVDSQVQTDAWIGLQKAICDCRQPATLKGVVHVQMDLAAHLLAQIIQRLLTLYRQVDQLSTIGIEQAARLGWQHAVGLSEEQTLSHSRLQMADPATERRLGQPSAL